MYMTRILKYNNSEKYYISMLNSFNYFYYLRLPSVYNKVILIYLIISIVLFFIIYINFYICQYSINISNYEIRVIIKFE